MPTDAAQFMVDGMWESFTFFALFHTFISVVGYGLKWGPWALASKEKH